MKRAAPLDFEGANASRTKRSSACLQCRKSKVKCDGTVPCGRCQQKNLVCEAQARRAVQIPEPSNGLKLADLVVMSARLALQQLKYRTTDSLCLMVSAFHFRHKRQQGPQPAGLLQELKNMIFNQLNIRLDQNRDVAHAQLLKWTQARRLTSDPADLVQQWQAWAPQECRKLFSLRDPGIVDVAVEEEVLTVTNEGFTSEFPPLEILRATHSKFEPPVSLIMDKKAISSIVPACINTLFQKPVEYDDQGCSSLSFERKEVVKMLGKDRPFLGLITVRVWILCHGAIVVRALSVVRLPETSYLLPLPEETWEAPQQTAPNLSLTQNQTSNQSVWNPEPSHEVDELGADEFEMDRFDFSSLDNWSMY